MNRVLRKTLSTVFLLTAVSFIGAVETTFAQRAARVTTRQVTDVLNQTERDLDAFSRELDAAASNRRANTDLTEVRDYVRDFEDAHNRLRQNFDARRETSADVQDLLDSGARINTFLNQTRLNTRVTSSWNLVRNDLTTLARYYNVSWNWNNYPTTRYPDNRYPDNRYPNNTSARNRLTGTYSLDVNRSTDVQAEIDRAIIGVASNRQDRIRRNAERRLTAPDQMAIERAGRSVTIASSNSPRVTFEADGRVNVEQMPNGRSMNITASFVGDQLTINYTGDRANDFYVAFNPVGNGETLRVTRRLYLEGVNRQITVDSVYTRTSTVAEFDRVYNGGGYNAGTGNTGGYPQSDTFIIPNGTQLSAILNTDLDTRTTQVGDSFTMEVRSPSEFNGALIEGRVAEVQRSGRVSGRAQLSLDFDRIRTRDGRTYRFAGVVQNIRTANGENVSINNEGIVREGDNQTTRTIGRTAVGAAIGAIIGAIAGGGQGAAIGAGVGAGAGAGSVVLQGRDDLSLRAGTELTISASAPRNVGAYR